jgi:hypothetical protein
MARVEIPAPGDLIMDTAGNVRVGVTVSLKLAGTGDGRDALQRPDGWHVHDGRARLRE